MPPASMARAGLRTYCSGRAATVDAAPPGSVAVHAGARRKPVVEAGELVEVPP